MCELFGLSSRGNVQFSYSLEEFALHGGRTHANKDGWGISFRSDKETFLVKEAAPASDSPWVQFIESQPIDCSLVLAHVRRASHGELTLENTHPFKRELGGRTHVFAHNGDVSEIVDTYPPGSTRFQAIGTTDSEVAFCLLLERMQAIWDEPETAPSLEQRLEVLAESASELRKFGTANFLYSDNEYLFVHGHQRRYDDNGVISEPRWPGLQLYQKDPGTPGSLAAGGVEIAATEEPVVMAASLPLFDETNWKPIPEGSILALQNGQIVSQIDS